jgi:hypothetical protein
MTRRTLVLSFRIQRFETTIIVGATALSVVVSALVIAILARGEYGGCFAGDGPVFTDACQSPAFDWLTRIARLSTAIVPFFPVIAGLLAGGPIVARELEAGTARLAWSLGPSRRQWFAQRALPLLAMVLLAGLAIGLTSGALIHLLRPGVDLDHAFVAFRARGVLVGAEALLVASIALAAGAILGRMVPTLILSLILLGGLGLAIDKVDRTLLLGEAEVVTSESFHWDTDYFLESRVKLPTGEVLTYEDAFDHHPELFGEWQGDAPPYTDVVLSIPGARYQDVERRETIAYVVLALAFVALAAAAVSWRRPR